MQQGFDRSSSLKLAFAVLLIMKWKQELIFALRRHTIFPSLPLSLIPQPPPKLVNHAHITSCKLCSLKVMVLLKLILLLVIVCLSLLSPFSLNDYHNRRVCKIWFCLVKRLLLLLIHLQFVLFFPWCFCVTTVDKLHISQIFSQIASLSSAFLSVDLIKCTI